MYQNDGGIPNFPNFRLGRLVGSPCDTLGTYWGIDDEDTNKTVAIQASPNPADDQVVFSFQLFNNHNTLDFLLYDQTGRQIEQISVSPFQSVLSYNVQTLPSGMYLGMLKDKARILGSVKFVVQ